MKTRTKLYIILGVIIIASVAFLFTDQKGNQGELKKASIEKGDIRTEISATGTINPISTVQVGTQVSGIISRIFVSHNDKVKKGQIIAEIDKTALLATLNDAESNLYRAQVQLEQTRKEHERNKTLFEEKAITQVEYENAYYAFLTAEANYKSALSQVDKARTNLGYATIIAPIDGVILSKDIDVGQTVAASFNTPTLFTIAQDLTKMEIQANVDEADIGQVKVGQKVDFTVDAFPDDQFKGTVKEIRLQSVVTSNVVTYTVIIAVSNEKQILMPGMTANVNITIKESLDVFKVPVSAVKFLPPPSLLKADGNRPQPDNLPASAEGNKKATAGLAHDLQNAPLKPGMERVIWLVRNDSIFPRKVTLGISDGSQIEIKGKGIQKGDPVAIGYSESSVSEGPQQNPFTPQFKRKK